MNILPLPKEIIPLHIFEPRYRQLVDDLTSEGEGFGILYSGLENEYQLGAKMKFERVLKKYPGGEMDIVCVTEGIFILVDYYNELENKLYPGGNVRMLELEDFNVSDTCMNTFLAYMSLKQEEKIEGPLTIDEIANELDLDNRDRLVYLKLLKPERRERFLLERIRYRKFIMEQENRGRNNFMYN